MIAWNLIHVLILPGGWISNEDIIPFVYQLVTVSMLTSFCKRYLLIKISVKQLYIPAVINCYRVFGHKGTPATLSGPVCSGNTQRARKADNSSTPGDSLYCWTDQVMRKTWRKERDEDSCHEKRKSVVLCGDVEFQKYVYYLLWVNMINGLLYLIFSLESWPATALIRITAVVNFLLTERPLYWLFIRAELPFSSASPLLPTPRDAFRNIWVQTWWGAIRAGLIQLPPCCSAKCVFKMHSGLLKNQMSFQPILSNVVPVRWVLETLPIPFRCGLRRFPSSWPCSSHILHVLCSVASLSR